MEETSLEDFLDGGTTDEPDDAATSESAAGDASPGDVASTADGTGATSDGTAAPPDEAETPPDEAAATPEDPVDGPTVTAAWSPDGVPCAACGARVTWRWGTDAGLVCPDCMDW